MAPRFPDLLRKARALLGPLARSPLAEERGESPRITLGPYLLEDPIGRGGICTVYRGRRPGGQEAVAVKLLHGELVSARAVERFEREIHLTRSLRHPNIVRILDWGRDESGTLYYAMELLDGLTLVELLDRYGPQPDGRVVHLLRQAAGALAEAHSAGVVHRDIKPANLMLCPGEAPRDLLKVLDFGLSHSLEAPDEGGTWGTPGYLAPELAAGQPHAPSCDLYALGVVARDLLTGTTACRRGEDAPELRDYTGRGLAALVERLTSADPRRRPASAEALLEALDRCRPCQPWTGDDAWSWWHRRSNYTPTEPQAPLVDAPPPVIP